MSRILVHIPMIPHGEYDVFSPFDSEKFCQVVQERCSGVCPNIGNRLWFQGLISEISTPENQIAYFSDTMSKDYINSSFDFIIAPMANVFSMNYVSLLERLATRFDGIRIPVYVIACGIQAQSRDQLDELCRYLKPSASAFIASVYNTGGEFALRGFLTKEFFEKLGFRSAVVTGCPSLFQCGPDLHITNDKVPKDRFLPLFNGRPQYYTSQMNSYPQAEYFDQETFFPELWNPDTFSDTEQNGKYLRRLVKAYGYEVTQLLLNERIRLIPDMNTWREYLIQKNFSLSFGSRIHGSIMPILAGIPTVLETRDARTQEMAEFFGIPTVKPGACPDAGSLYELYQGLDYSVFNRKFRQRYDAYEDFLKQYGIVKQIRRDNVFFKSVPDLELHTDNGVRLEELRSDFYRARAFYVTLDRMIQAKRKLLPG